MCYDIELKVLKDILHRQLVMAVSATQMPGRDNFKIFLEGK